MSDLNVHLASPIKYPSFVDLNHIEEIGDSTYRFVLAIPFVLNSKSQKDSLIVIMKNPSSASAKSCDLTISKVCNVARHNGYSGVIVMNLFPFRATYARDVISFYGSCDYSKKMSINLDYIKQKCQGKDVVFAWGTDTIGGRRMFPDNYNNAIIAVRKTVTERIYYVKRQVEDTAEGYRLIYPLHALRWSNDSELFEY